MPETLTAEEVQRNLGLFSQYHARAGNHDKFEDWAFKMLSLAHEDWQKEKLTNFELAHLVDMIMCH